MTKEELAEKLNGREYGDEIESKEAHEAKQSGIVVLFGASDDNAEFRGAIDEELGCYEGGEFLITKDKAFEADTHNCDCEYCGFKELTKSAKKIEAVWNKYGYSWTYKTEIPHATFDILEDGEKFCRGIVFNISDL